jgi:hypothetical protein
MAASAAVRNYLTFRFALHLGVRSRNLRELLLCAPGQAPRNTNRLEQLQRGELRWMPGDRTWQVIILAVAFKNGRGSFLEGDRFK